MTTFTDKELIKEIKERISSLDVRDNIERRAYEIALASLEADPVAYIFKHPAGKLFWALTDESNKEQPDVIPVYAAAPASVVPDNASEPLAYAYKELTPEIMRNHLAVFERYGIAPNDSSTTIHALRIALDGIERSDAMLHGAEPVSQTHKSQHTQFEQVADLYEMQFDDGRTCAFHTDAQKAAQWLQACDGNRVQEYVKLERLRNALSGNYPVTPDGWISCSERMPAEDDWILIYSKHGEYMAGQVQGEYVELSDGTLSWLGNALYWMPLPELPQEVS
ncbi:TPA: DUF551 domain-containing protein [Escherichia coli]|nr:DUF551 domain-containing protein [Escherichia coli]HBE5617247.1 DUF551 domain-containing protein [Escherichia coli]